MPDLATHFQSRIVEGSGLAAHVAADYVLSAGWGATPSVAVLGGTKDLGGEIDITSAGAGQAANPTVTLTFKDPFDAPPVVTCSRGDVAGAAGDFRVTSRSATQVVFTFVGTPVAAQTYRLAFHVKGR